MSPSRTKPKPRFCGELAVLAGELRVLRRLYESKADGPESRRFVNGKRALERKLGRVFKAAFMRVRGRREVEKAVLAGVFFWDWWGVEWFGGGGAGRRECAAIYLREPDWSLEARLACRGELTDADDVEIAVGLVFAGYRPEYAAKRLIVYHGETDVVKTDEEKAHDPAAFEAEILERLKTKERA